MKRIRLFTSALVLGVSSLLPILAPAVVHAVANNCTWTGASSNNFNTAGNWSGCNSTVPQTGDNLIFPNTGISSDTTLTNNITSLSVGSITFNGTGSDKFIISGNAITVASGIVATKFAQINTDLTLGADQSITGAGLFYGDANTTSPVINLNGHNLTLGSGSDTPTIYVDGSLSGTGNVNVLDGVATVWSNDNSAWTGALSVASGASVISYPGSLGSSSSTVTITSGGILQLCGYNNASIPQDITVGGASALYAFTACGQNSQPGDAAKVTLAGTITLTADTTINTQSVTTITGPLSGNFTIAPTSDSTGSLVINSSNNTSQTANGTVTPPVQTVNYGDNDSSQTLDIPNNTIGIVDGTYGDTTVESAATMKGTGTVGALTVFGILAPGHSPGCITTTSDFDLAVTSTYQEEIGGTDACTSYDQMKVTGTVTLDGGALQVSRYNDFKPVKGQVYTIIDNDGSDAVIGTFGSLAEGATVTVDGYVLAVSYVGGDGNDVTLTVKSIGSPDTGFTLLKSNPLMSSAVILVAAGGVAYIARGKKFSFARSRVRR